MAYKHSLGTAQEAAEKLASFFISLGCNKVYDINLARHLALVESYQEFKKRRTDKTNLPIISSICPGWICYAEKTNGDLIIPHLSKVRSPQQIMGAILKRTLCSNGAKKRSDIFHVTLMPCFDKKLEASRQDFKDSIDDSQDVDCVLTPVELEEILDSEGVTLAEFEPRKLDVLMVSGVEFDRPLTSNLGSVSGGYAENLLLAEAKEALGSSNSDNIDKIDHRADLEYSTLKNGDFIEINFKKPPLARDGGVSGDDVDVKLPKVAIVNGFRNIQTIVQRLKRKALKYDYIEIMACPSGCINGGAQCRPSSGDDQEAAIESTKAIYNRVPQVMIGLDSSAANNKQIYEKLSLEGDVHDLLYTDFHSVPKMQNLTVNW